LMAGLSVDWNPIGPTDDGSAFVADGSILIANGKVVLEEFAFKAEKNNSVQTIAGWLKDKALPAGDEYAYWRDTLEKRLVILPENAFRDFVQLSTEVIARVRIDDTKKTVERGALWTEEHLPSETLLYATLFASKPRVQNPPSDLQDAAAVLNFVKSAVDGKRLQLGGDATVGRGIVKARVVEPKAQAQGASTTQPGGQP
jgi:CRISPR-associated protein Cmr4